MNTKITNKMKIGTGKSSEYHKPERKHVILFNKQVMVENSASRSHR